MASWEFILVSLSVGFANGGFGGLFVCFIVTVTCFFSVVLSLAEMASMAPTSGGQYHWVSEFSPPAWQKVLSYSSGWMSTLGWLASTAGSTQVLAIQIEAMVQVYKPDFYCTGWQTTLLMWAFNLVTIGFNTWGSGFMPALEIGSLILHAVGFFIVLIPILVMTPKNSAEEVFSHWENNSGWGSMGTAFMLSQITILYCSLGSDSVVHISEEVEDASVTVPRCMVWSFVGNIFAGFVMLIAMLFCIGPLEDVLAVDVPYALLFNNTGSRPLSLFLNLLLLILIYAGNITSLATSAREMWAFSRDNGLPFSPWLSKMYVERLLTLLKHADENEQEPQVEHSIQQCLRHICHRRHSQFDPARQLSGFRDSRLPVSPGSVEYLHDQYWSVPSPQHYPTNSPLTSP